jgi:hypothetical protein
VSERLALVAGPQQFDRLPNELTVNGDPDSESVTQYSLFVRQVVPLLVNVLSGYQTDQS